MSSIVCQGLQSCLEPWLVEPRTLGLKLAPPTPYFSRSLVFARNPCGSDSDTDKVKEKCYSDTENNNSNMDDSKNNNIPRIGSSNGDLGGNWNFIKALTNTKEEAKEKESFYVHPMVKRSSSKLSEKSLELCTESLGSETGTDMSENSDIDISSSCSSDSESGGGGVTVKSINISKELQPQFGQQVSISSGKVSNNNNNNNSHKFPPPLTSISGSNCVHVRTHREGGRLVIKAVTVPTPHTYFQAERSDGRLTLRFLKNQSHHIDCEAAKEGKERTNYVKDEEENQDEEHEEEEEEEEEDEEDEDYEEDDEEEDDDHEEEEEEEIENKERSDVYFGEEINGNDKGEMGIRKFRRPSSRCNTGAFLGGGYLKPCFGRSLAVAEM